MLGESKWWGCQNDGKYVQVEAETNTVMDGEKEVDAWQGRDDRNSIKGVRGQTGSQASRDTQCCRRRGKA